MACCPLDMHDRFLSNLFATHFTLSETKVLQEHAYILQFSKPVVAQMKAVSVITTCLLTVF
jgi:hypothetical protein